MAERIYQTEALILRRSDFSESDRLLLLATPKGKQRVIAKGVRKTMSRLAGHIELFTHSRMLLAIGRNLDIITQSQIIAGFTTIHTDLTRLSYAYYLSELYDRFTEEGEDNSALFGLLRQTFTVLDATPHPDLVLRWYELRLLHNVGYRPHFHYCAVCQEVLNEQTDCFSPTLGGALCSRDADKDPTALPMSNPCFRLLRYLQIQSHEVILYMNLSAAICGEAEYLLRAYVRHVLERDLKSVAFIDSLRK